MESILDEQGLIRDFCNTYGQALYERLCDKFAGQPDSFLIDAIRRAMYGNPQENYH